MNAGSFDVTEFFRTYWRKKPIFIKGGAYAFLGKRWTESDFDEACAKARSEGASIKERPGQVTFIENVSKYNPFLAERCRHFQALFGLPTVWFDTIRTYSPNGIGEHFDHSDNFVLNMEGTKQWTLGSPDSIAADVIAKRMMNVPGYGAHPIPEKGAMHFTLEPGDLLYLPLFWLHSGVSEAESLSVSLVCPAMSLYSAVTPLMTKLAKSRLIGHEPIPALHSGLTRDERESVIGEIRVATADLLAKVTSEKFLRDLFSLQADLLGHRPEPARAPGEEHATV